MLDDLLMPGLKIVICGSAAGKRSAERGEYYAGKGNKFWTVLFEVGLTPRRLAPSEYRDLLKYGIGLTDVVKNQAGTDDVIDFALSSPEDLRKTIKRCAPLMLAFNGKKAAKVFLKKSRLDFGLQPESVGETRLWVAPSTSAMAADFWDIRYWHELASLVR